MKLQLLQDTAGNPTGIFVPIEDWALIKTNYPDIESVGVDLSEWEKEIIDQRLEAIKKNPDRLKPINGLLEELRRKI